MAKVICSKNSKTEFTVQVVQGDVAPQDVGIMKWFEEDGWMFTPASTSMSDSFNVLLEDYLEDNPVKREVFITQSPTHIKYVIAQALRRMVA